MVTTKSLNQDILKIAIPNILGNVTIALLGIVDTYLMGHEANGEVMIGAIGLAGIIFNIIYWNFGFLRVATTGITAQAFGEKNEQKQALTFLRALLLGIIIAAIILLTKSLIGDFGFNLLENKKNAEAIQYGQQYFNIRILAVPAVMALYSFRGWFYGMQNAIYPFIITTVINVVNILASIYFVKVLGLSVKGVAWGTVVAQYTALFVAIVLMGKYRDIYHHMKLKSVLMKEQIDRFFKVSRFVFGRNIMLSLVFSFFTYFSSTVSESYLAANQILLQFFYLMSYAVDGFAYASEALIGKFTGAKDKLAIHKAVKWTMIWGVGLGVIYAFAYQLVGVDLLYLFTPDDVVVNAGKPYIFWLSIIAIIGAIAFIWDGIFIGATLVEEMFLSMTIATVCFFGLYFLMKKNQPEHAIWAAMTVYMLVRGVGQWLLFEHKKNRQG